MTKLLWGRSQAQRGSHPTCASQQRHKIQQSMKASSKCNLIVQLSSNKKKTADSQLPAPKSTQL